MLTEVDVEILLAVNTYGDIWIKKLSEMIGKPYALVHNHVKKLVNLGVLEERKEGKKVVLSLTPKGARVLKAYMEALKELRFDG